ncbi:MAG: hypothetical protein II888_07355 [Clostridia bacterium]|nr:hypothetical protein [Clostridia bacterium]
MKRAVVGLDTSNYRTSLAAVSLEGDILLNLRELLPVAQGERGLRQSDALYAHLKQMKRMEAPLREALQGWKIAAVCASTRPRDRLDSYMPVFEAGETAGRLMAAAEEVPFFATDHQHGHLRAALRGTALEGEKSFLALHLSGGTTDLLFAREDGITELGSSLDLHAGQLMDRVGVAMGCSFPAGPEMEKLAEKGNSQGRLGCAMEPGDLSCHLSGAEAQAMRLLRTGEAAPEDLSREVFDLLARTVSRMLIAGAGVTGCCSALVCGGIASSRLFRQMLTERAGKRDLRLRIHFGDPGLSGDNAVGAALIGRDRLRAGEYGTAE